jgi:hypothetical protein
LDNQSRLFKATFDRMDFWNSVYRAHDSSLNLTLSTIWSIFTKGATLDFFANLIQIIWLLEWIIVTVWVKQGRMDFWISTYIAHDSSLNLTLIVKDKSSELWIEFQKSIRPVLSPQSWDISCKKSVVSNEITSTNGVCSDL